MNMSTSSTKLLTRVSSFSYAITLVLFIQACQNEPPPIDPVVDYDMAIERLEDAIQYELEDKDLQAISVVLVADGQTIWNQGFGFSYKEATAVPDTHTVYRVGSVSKLFTDMAIMQKVEEGLIDLDAPVQQYLPSFNPQNQHSDPITLRQLMSHRSGLLREPRLGNYFDDSGVSLQSTVESINNSALIYPPGQKTKYSNAGIAVVGYLLESLSQIPYTRYMETNLLRPLGMHNSTFMANALTKENLAYARMWSYDKRSFDAPSFDLGMAPAGSLYSTTSDMGRFMRHLLDIHNDEIDGIVSKETLEKMWTPQFESSGQVDYGLGFRLNDFHDMKQIGHGGAIYGFSTQLSMIPELNIGVACMSSVDVTNAVTQKLSQYALELLHAIKANETIPEYPKTRDLPVSEVKDLLGFYRSEKETVSLKLDRQKLMLSNSQGMWRMKQDNQGMRSDSRHNFDGFRMKSTPRGIQINQRSYERIEEPKVSDFPAEWIEYLGEYGDDHNILYVFENFGSLYLLMEWIEFDQLTPIAKDIFAFPTNSGMYHGEKLIFKRDPSGSVSSVEIEHGPIFEKRNLGASTSETFKINPIRPVAELRPIALKADPPKEDGEFVDSDLVDLRSLDSSIRYDIRYATTNNFMNSEFYTTPMAFMQRPAAEAVVRVHQKLKRVGYGLLIHDAYRPWYVTKMFWDATPQDKKIFVANPSSGSRHNRGCAVDLSLFDLKTGKVIEMVAGFDEMTDRSFPDYVGGTTSQRYHRSLLRRYMEAEGFSVYRYEWWHFDYVDWRNYALGNLTFEQLSK